MTSIAVGIVVAGTALSLAVGLAAGLDARGAITLSFIVALGCLAVAVARKTRAGKVSPATCPHCGGIVSSQAPYCKHCRNPL